MELKVKILVKEKQPDDFGWYDTDKGELFYWSSEQEWSCRDDRISSEYPSWWLAEPSSVPQANELLPHVSNNEVAVCVNCDEEKETHSICSDCLTKIINENKQTDC